MTTMEQAKPGPASRVALAMAELQTAMDELMAIDPGTATLGTAIHLFTKLEDHARSVKEALIAQAEEGSRS